MAEKPNTTHALEIPVITAEALMSLASRLVIDLRSPGEFAEDHVPGAFNVPLFDDVERALVGTLYKQASPSAAFEEGRKVVAAKVHALVGEISRLSGWRPRDDDLVERVRAMTCGGFERLSSELMSAPSLAPARDPIVLHCWRGGLRSRSVIALVRALGLERATLLEGGYKGYRAHVAERLETCTFPRTFVLRGLTGVGKTLVLRELERLHPRWTLDLEALAGHRSSLLGMVGLEPASQKMFESRLLERVRLGFPSWMVIEGESRKVGNASLPPRLWEHMSTATSIGLTASIERRVRVLCDDYLADDARRAELAKQLPHVEARMTRKQDAPSLVALLQSGATDELVRVLLDHYYDPLYRHAEKNKVLAASFDASDPTRAAHEIAAWIEGETRASGRV
jgi:tRNA 2-selenouridine synthase